LLLGFELVGAYAADGADKICGQIVPGGTGSDIRVGIADLGVIDIPTHLTYVSHGRPFKSSGLLYHSENRKRKIP
jgi:hypothetical protein